MIVRSIRRHNMPFIAKICSWLAIYLPCLVFMVISRSPLISAQAPTPQPSSDWIAEIVRIEFVFDSMRDSLSGQPSLDFQEITMHHIQDRLEQYSEVQTNVVDLSVTADISDQEMSQGTEEFLPLRVVVSILLRYKTFSGLGDPVGWVGSTFASAEDQEAFISSISLSNPEVFSGLKTVDSILVEGKKPIKRTEAPTLSPTPSPSVATELQSEFVDVAFRLMPMEGVLDTMGIIDFEQVTSHYSEVVIATRGNVHDVRVALNVQDQFMERDGREMLTNSDNSLRYLQNEPVSTLVVSARMLLEYRTADQANSNPEEWVAGAFDNAEEKLAFIEELRQVNANAFGSVESVEVLTGDDIPTKPPPELLSSFVDLAVRLVSTEGVLNDMEKVDFQIATAGYIQQVMENDSRIYDARVALNIVDQFIDNGNAFNTRFLQLEEVEALVVSTRLLAEFRFLGDSQDVDAEGWTADAFKNEKAQNAYIKSLQLENPDAFRFVESVEVLVGEDIPSSATHISVTVPITMRLLNTRTTLQSDQTSTFEEGTAAHVQGYIDSLHEGLQSLQVDVSVTDQVVIFDIDQSASTSSQLPADHNTRVLQVVRPLQVSVNVEVKFRTVRDVPIEDWVVESFDSDEKLSSYVEILHLLDPDAFEYLERVIMVADQSAGVRDSQRDVDLSSGGSGGDVGAILGVTMSAVVLVALAAIFTSRRNRPDNWESSSEDLEGENIEWRDDPSEEGVRVDGTVFTSGIEENEI